MEKSKLFSSLTIKNKHFPKNTFAYDLSNNNLYENFDYLVYIGMFLVTFGVVFNVAFYRNDKQNL